jgi:hypothetical protein
LDKLSDQYSQRRYHLRSDASRISPSTIGYVLAMYGLHSVHTSMNHNSLFFASFRRLDSAEAPLSPDRCEWFEYTYVIGSSPDMYGTWDQACSGSGCSPPGCAAFSTHRVRRNTPHGISDAIITTHDHEVLPLARYESMNRLPCYVHACQRTFRNRDFHP